MYVLKLPFRKTKLGIQSLSYVWPNSWNSLPDNLESATSVIHFLLLFDWFDICMFQFVWKNALFESIDKACGSKIRKKVFIIFYNFCWNITLLSNFWLSKLFMILHMYSGLIKSKEKLLVESMFSRITFILGWFWCFSMAFLIFTVSLSEECLLDQNIWWKLLLIRFHLK